MRNGRADTTQEQKINQIGASEDGRQGFVSCPLDMGRRHQEARGGHGSKNAERKNQESQSPRGHTPEAERRNVHNVRTDENGMWSPQTCGLIR